jgi:MFS family permease
MLWFVCMFNYADRQAIFSVFPVLRQEMGLSDIELGLLGSAFMWVYALALPLAGIVGDRVSRKTLILGGLIFWSLITIATALSTEYWHLLLFRGLEGFGEAFYFPASMAMISDYHSPRTRSRAMALHQSGVYIGTIAGGTAAGYLAELFGWRSGFYVFGILGAVLGVALLTLLKEPIRGQADASRTRLGTHDERDEAYAAPDVRKTTFWRSVGEILLNPTIVVLIVVFAGANGVAAIALAWMPTFLHDKFGMSLGTASLTATMSKEGGSVLGVLVGGFLADLLARHFSGGRMATQALGLFLGIPFIFLTGWTPSALVLIVVMVGFGFCKGIYDSNIWASLHDIVRPENRATALGFMNSIGWVGGAAATFAIGAAAQRFGMSASLSANSLMYLAMGLLMCFGIWTLLRTQRSSFTAHTNPKREREDV